LIEKYVYFSYFEIELLLIRVMAQSQTKSNILTVVLKHMQLEPSHSIVPKNTSILLKISHSNVNTYS